MDALQEASFEFTRWLQQNYANLEPLFSGVSALIRFEVYFAIITLIYWCLNKKLGRSLAYLLSFSVLLVEMLKHIFRDPRPYWLDATLGLKEEASYGAPSGHAILSTVLYGFLAIWFRKSWVWLSALTLIFLTIVSRIYLGVHDLEDVLAGMLLGVLILILFLFWRHYLVTRYSNRILGQRLLIVVVLPLAMGAIYLITMLLLGQPDYDVPWASRIDPAEKEAIENISRAFGALLGLGIGFVLEGSRVRFLATGLWWKRALRYVFGMVVAVGLWLGLGAVSPDDPLWLGVSLRFARYLLLSLWIAYYAPMVFVRIGLADASPEPETSLTL